MANIAPDGRVLIVDDISGNWSTICDDGWNDQSATVLCRHTGMGDKGIASTASRDYTYSSKEVSISCYGTEANINECSYYESSCFYIRDAVAECFQNNGRDSNNTSMHT